MQNTGIHAPALTRLSVGAAAEMTDAGIRTVLRSCRKLRSLEVTDGGGELMGLDWGGVGRDADVPTLQYLRLARCGHLRALRLTAPMLRSMAATDCDALRDLALAPSTGELGDGASMTDLRELTLGGFGGYRAGGGCKVPGNALADIVARCANLSFLSVPASCGAGDERRGNRGDLVRRVGRMRVIARNPLLPGARHDHRAVTDRVEPRRRVSRAGNAERGNEGGSRRGREPPINAETLPTTWSRRCRRAPRFAR